MINSLASDDAFLMPFSWGAEVVKNHTLQAQIAKHIAEYDLKMITEICNAMSDQLQLRDRLRRAK